MINCDAKSPPGAVFDQPAPGCQRKHAPSSQTEPEAIKPASTKAEFGQIRNLLFRFSPRTLTLHRVPFQDVNKFSLRAFALKGRSKIHWGWSGKRAGSIGVWDIPGGYGSFPPPKRYPGGHWREVWVYPDSSLEMWSNPLPRGLPHHGGRCGHCQCAQSQQCDPRPTGWTNSSKLWSTSSWFSASYWHSVSWVPYDAVVKMLQDAGDVDFTRGRLPDNKGLSKMRADALEC